MLAAKTEAGAVLPMARFATGVTVVMAGGFVLLSKLVSIVGELTTAKLVSVPLVGAVTVRVKLLVCPEIKLPSDQLTTPELFTPPPLALTNVTPAGIASVTTTVLAVDGPRFVTEIM